MIDGRHRDMMAGGALTCLGSAYAAYALIHYDTGSLRQMGPGMFPAGLGCVLAAFGLAIFIQALSKPTVGSTQLVLSPRSLRSAAMVLAAIMAFAATIPTFGLLPAVITVVVISALAEPQRRPLEIAALTLALCLMAYVIFKLGLGMTVPLARWPFD